MMCKKFVYLTFIFVLSLVCTSYTSAGIVYVDATQGEAGNTTLATGEVLVADDPGTSGSGADGLWRGRAFANEGTIFEAGGSWEADLNTEDCPRLMTTVEVEEGAYDVYVYMWCDDTGAQWRLQASLEDLEGDLPLYLANDPNGVATVAVAEDFEDPVPMLTEGNRILWQVKLGTTDVTTAITVYVDDDPNHLTGNARTWYDGIGYELAAPKIVYVDAVDESDPNVAANTTYAVDTGEVFAPIDPGTAGSGADGLWRKRVFANEGTIFEAGGSWEADLNTEDVPRLVTSVDVPEGFYDVYVYMWCDDTGAQWRLQASLEDLEGDLPLYLANDPNGVATVAVAEDFEKPVPMLAEGNRILWQVYLGTTELTSAITVYIDDDPNHITGNNRSWYDGIGYKIAPGVIPVDPGAEGLLASYSLDGDLTDASGNGNDGVMMGGDPVYVDGVAGQALSLDGSDDYVDCGANPLLGMQETNQMTAAGWCSIRACTNAWQCIVAKGEYAWRLSDVNVDPSFHFGITWWQSADNYGVSGTTVVGFDEWHHVAGTFDGTNINVYLDGVLDGTITTTEPIGANEQPVCIGNNPYDLNRWWDGLIDEVVIYNRALSEAEIAYLAQ